MSPTVHEQTLKIDHKNGYTAGHFEGHPIVPGAVSLNWMIEALKSFLNQESLGTYQISNLKCLKELSPPCEVNISIDEKRPKFFSLKLSHAGEQIVSVNLKIGSLR